MIKPVWLVSARHSVFCSRQRNRYGDFHSTSPEKRLSALFSSLESINGCHLNAVPSFGARARLNAKYATQEKRLRVVWRDDPNVGHLEVVR